MKAVCWEQVMMSEEELREQGLFGLGKVERREDLIAVFRNRGWFRQARAILGGAQ